MKFTTDHPISSRESNSEVISGIAVATTDASSINRKYTSMTGTSTITAFKPDMYSCLESPFAFSVVILPVAVWPTRSLSEISEDEDSTAIAMAWVAFEFYLLEADTNAQPIAGEALAALVDICSKMTNLNSDAARGLFLTPPLEAFSYGTIGVSWRLHPCDRTWSR